MSNLKELIDRLHEEVIQRQDEADTASEAMYETSDTDLDVERLNMVVRQMAEVLQKEDLDDLQADGTLEPDHATRLILQWENLCTSISGLERHIKELEADIARMQPWGDFDVVKLNQLEAHDCHVRFWKMPVSVMASMSAESWFSDAQATVISRDQADAYFITISLGDEEPDMPPLAEAVEICPCPVSTLIMLQTRDKDSLKKLITRQGDFALVHYAELRETLRELLPPGAELPKKRHSHRQALKARLKKIFTHHS